MRRSAKLTLVGAWIFSMLAFVETPLATAATVGSGNCIQIVGSATGITVTTYSDRCVVKFTSTTATTWTVPRGVTKVWVLAVGGGGGGGYDEGGGGGAGGFLENQNFVVSPQSTIILDVGLGGAGAVGDDTGGDGGNSVFGSLTAIGGGGGGTAVNSSTAVAKKGRPGGSGGGGSGAESYGAGSAGAGTTGQGFRGDSGTSTRGGGGGGASEVGDANGTARGGDGKGSTILNGSTVTNFAGGGGGGGGNSVSGAVAGGLGGGGASGGNSTCPVAGTVNTGGGGGGGGGTGGSCTAYNGAAGGSGIIIVNYQFDATAPTISSATSQLVAENTSTSTTILSIKASESTTMVIASGLDSSSFTLIYSDSVTSLLRFATVPNYEAPLDVGLDNVYNFTLDLEDYSGNVSTQAFVVTVTDVNEAPVIGSFSGSTTATYSLTENTSTLFNLNATDQDTATTLTYSLTGTDASDFSLSTSGELTFISGPDFEDARDSNSDNVYLVIAWVSDGTLSDSQTVTITVTDLNESGSVSSPTLSSVATKGVSVTISVSLNAHGKVLFTSNGKRISRCINVRTTGTYQNITATCNWKPAVTGRTFIQARLTPALNTFSVANSERLSLWVVKRTTTR
jgi:hypothetical protein